MRNKSKKHQEEEYMTTFIAMSAIALSLLVIAVRYVIINIF